MDKKGIFSDEGVRKQLVNEILDDYEKRRLARQELESKWKLNSSFYEGKQDVIIAPNGELWQSDKDFFWRKNESYNHIAPIVETRISKLNNVNTAISVRPTSNDTEDIETAKFATKIIKSVVNSKRFTNLIADAVSISEITGSVFYRLMWDDKAIISKGKTMGDILVEVCSPYEIFPDNLKAKSIEELHSIIHAKAYNIDDIEMTYGIVVDNGFSNNQSSQALVITRYTMPTVAHPQGKMEIVCGETLLFAGELPYVGVDKKHFLPFVRQLSISSRDGFFGSSIVERIIPVQRAYNSLKNRKHELLSRIASGIIAVEDGSIDVENLEVEGLAPGKILTYRQGSNPPTVLELGRVPPDFLREEQSLLNEFTMISGVSDLMQYSSVPSNMTSGIAISLLVEQDDSKLFISASYIREAMKMLGKMIIAIYKNFASKERLELFAGECDKLPKNYFERSNITADDIVFDTENEVIDSPSSRKNMVYELLKLGILTDENGKISDANKLKVLEILGLGNWESIRVDEDIHIKKAGNENLEVIDGKLPQVNKYDRHDLHIKEHIRQLITGQDKEIFSILDNHIKEHAAFLQGEI